MSGYSDEVPCLVKAQTTWRCYRCGASVYYGQHYVRAFIPVGHPAHPGLPRAAVGQIGQFCLACASLFTDLARVVPYQPRRAAG